MIITADVAIEKLRPNSIWQLVGSQIEWIEDTGNPGNFIAKNVIWDESNTAQFPSKQEINAELQKLQLEWENTQYQRDRAPEYPPIGDQLDALWKGGEDAEEMLAKVQAVKAKYPKPE